MALIAQQTKRTKTVSTSLNAAAIAEITESAEIHEDAILAGSVVGSPLGLSVAGEAS